MAQTRTGFTPTTPDYITPIRCPHCAANSHLVHRIKAVTGDGKGEIRSFECADCKAITEMFVRD